MQYLARVQNNLTSGINLQLLARHILPENTWVVDDGSRSVHLADEQIPETFTPRVGFFVLVELDDKGSPYEIEDVTDRLLAPLQQEWLAKEKETIEQWRHECTLRSQELSIRDLELVSRKEELDRREQELDRREQELDG